MSEEDPFIKDEKEREQKALERAREDFIRIAKEQQDMADKAKQPPAPASPPASPPTPSPKE